MSFIAAFFETLPSDRGGEKQMEPGVSIHTSVNEIFSLGPKPEHLNFRNLRGGGGGAEAASIHGIG